MGKKIIIAGGSGFIGRALCAALADRGYEVVILSRTAKGATEGRIRSAAWDARSSSGWLHEAEGAHAIINLAGENVAEGRWTARKKERIISSRTSATEAVMDALSNAKARPAVLIQASAAGFYGTEGGDAVLDEMSPSGGGFLAEVTRQWERASEGADSLGVRRAVIRTGIVLSRGGGALEKLMFPYRFFAGSYIGPGSQYLSWIHMADEIGAILHLLEKDDLKGVFNLTAPWPVTAKEFAQALGKRLGRPAWIKVPPPVIKALFGEMGREALISGQRVVPTRLIESGFVFRFQTLDDALRDLIR